MTEETVNNLKNLLEDIAKENGYGDGRIDIKPVSSGGASFSSALYVATISAPQKKDLKLFAKVANVSEEFRNKTEGVSSIFIKERLFYTELVDAFKKLYDKHNVPEKDRLYVAKYYGHSTNELEETLVLENLVVSGFESFDRFKTFDLKYACKAIEQLAKFHALGLACKEGNFKELENVKKYKVMSIFEDEKYRKLYIEQAYKMGTQAVKEEYRNKVKKFLEENDILYGMSQLWNTNYDGNIVHSDFRPSNLMHRSKNGELEIVPLDYQTYHFGLLAADLLNFLWIGSDSEFRQKHYQELLEYYYKELTKSLWDLKIEINAVYPRKTFEQELEDCKTLGLFLGLVFIPIITVDAEDAPENALENMILEPNQLAIDRMNGIVGDYIRWGII